MDRVMEQLYKCFQNKHYPNLKEYISKFGNIEKSGYLIRYALPGVSMEHWEEISFAEFAGEAAPEALVLIEFINTHKRLPNWILPFWIKLDYSVK
jgi:hypothetical protein